MSRNDQLGLLLPNPERVVTDNVKQRIVLDRRERQLQNVADESASPCKPPRCGSRWATFGTDMS